MQKKKERKKILCIPPEVLELSSDHLERKAKRSYSNYKVESFINEQILGEGLKFLR
jgi:hypothetical protein